MKDGERSQKTKQKGSAFARWRQRIRDQRKGWQPEAEFKEEQPHYVKSLQPPDVHHVVAALGDDAHDLHGSLRGGAGGKQSERSVPEGKAGALTLKCLSSDQFLPVPARWRAEGTSGAG